MTTTVSSEPFVFSPGAAAPSAGPASRDGTDRLVAETRREISEIVREVAVAVRSDRTTNEFFGLLGRRRRGTSAVPIRPRRLGCPNWQRSWRLLDPAEGIVSGRCDLIFPAAPRELLAPISILARSSRTTRQR